MRRFAPCYYFSANSHNLILHNSAHVRLLTQARAVGPPRQRPDQSGSGEPSHGAPDERRSRAKAEAPTLISRVVAPFHRLFSCRHARGARESGNRPPGYWNLSCRELSFERSRWRGRRFACYAQHVMPPGGAFNCDFRFCPILVSRAKSIYCRRKKIQFP